MYNPSIHRQLLQIKAGHRAPDIGICNNLCIFSDYGTKRLHKAILSWPQRKGEGHSYPVEGSMRKYCEAAISFTMWKNPRRLALLNYLIEYYKPQAKISKALLKSK